MQKHLKELCIQQTELGDFLPSDECVCSDRPLQQQAKKLEDVTRTMIGECFRWHFLAKDNCFFEDQKVDIFHKRAQVLFRAQAIFSRQSNTSDVLSLSDEECETVLRAKKITSDLLPTFGTWKSLETMKSPWTEGPSEDELSAARVAMNSLFTNFIQRVVPQSVRKVVASRVVEPAMPDHQHS